jgi:protein-L-isoaspartate O-methyltransferase
MVHHTTGICKSTWIIVHYIPGLLEAYADEDLLIIGTGTGYSAIEASRHVHHVKAVDVSKKMLSDAGFTCKIRSSNGGGVATGAKNKLFHTD